MVSLRNLSHACSQMTRDKKDVEGLN